MGRAVLHEGSHTDAVDGIGMEGRRLRVLTNDLLGDAETLGGILHVDPQFMEIGEILLIQLLNAAAAVEIHRLDDHIVLICHEGGELLFRAGKNVDGLAAHEGTELLKEGVFIVENGGVGAVVDPLDEGGGADTGEIGGALGIRKTPELKHHIVGRARAILVGAAEHIHKESGGGLAADSVGLLGLFPHAADGHIFGSLH